MRWYADNSELNGIKESDIPDILLFGGVVVNIADEEELKKSIEDIKETYGGRRLPLKWNIKDLKQMYTKQKKEDIYKKLLESSREWRCNIFEKIREFDFKIIISVLESHSAKRKTIKSKKEELTRFVFANSLMRYGLHVKDVDKKHAEVILDWPDKGESTPFDSEYTSAYNSGTTHDQAVKYHCGALNKLGFIDHALYANMKHSTLLQLSDLIVGASREFVECSLGKKKAGQGVDCIKRVQEKFRGYPKSIYGYGINVASGNSEFKGLIKKGIQDLILAA